MPLQSPASEDSDHVHIDHREVDGVNSIGITTTISANRSTSRSFTIDPGSLSPSEYVIEASVGYDTGDEGGTEPYRVEFIILDADGK